jgi:3-oxoacyl-[acyl-carrier-protein] synthase II
VRRIVVTGMGIISPIGNTVADSRAALVSGRSGIRAIPEYSRHAGLRSFVGGRVEGIDPRSIPRTWRRTMGRMAVLAGLAASDAVRQAGLSEDLLASSRCGVALGSTTGASKSLEEFFRIFISTNGFLGLEGTLFPRVMSHTVAANTAAMLGTRGRILSVSSACASSTQAIGAGFEAIRSGAQEVMVCGGADDMHPSTVAVFDVLGAASRNYNDKPARTPRPFDRDRDGLVLSEGAGVVVLEEYEHALRRGAPMFGEIVGYGTCGCARHMTQPDGQSMLECMRLALDCAGVRPAELSYINAHATGTQMGDAVEAETLRALVADRVPVSCTKGHTGHTLAACGAMEVIFCLLMLREKFIAPTLNLENVSPDCAGLTHVKNVAHRADLRLALSSNFAFGGVSASLVIRKL